MSRTTPRERFRVLHRAFFDQFLTSQSVTADHRLHQSFVWILIFLLVPGAFVLAWLLPEFEGAVIRARLGRAPASVIDDYLVWIAFFLTTYSMVAVGFITVLAWDGLTFSRRDALVLSPLPLTPRSLLGAKLLALTTLLMGVTAAVGTVNALGFALVTANQLGIVAFFSHFFAMFIAAVGSGLFVFAAIVALRGLVSLLGGGAIADACAPPLQFLCVVLVLCLMLLSPAVWQVSFVTATFTGWMPSAWFVGIFEQLRQSPRAADPAFPFHLYAVRALAGTSIVIVAALGLSVLEFLRQMGAALAPDSDPGLLGGAYISRVIATIATGRNRHAGGVADFVLLTLARDRSQQAPVALYSAVGAAVIIVALAQNTSDVQGLMKPRTAMLWIPLVMAYWLTLGLRAAFFKPSDLPAAWSFRLYGEASGMAQWLAVRAAMLGFVWPRAFVMAIALGPFIGWRVALWHAVIVCALTVMLVDVLALTVRQIPFTRAYEPGHVRLRSRWPFYALGLFVFGYVPARWELHLLQGSGGLAVMMLVVLALAAGVSLVTRLIASMRSSEAAGEEEAADFGVGRLGGLDLAG